MNFLNPWYVIRNLTNKVRGGENINQSKFKNDLNVFLEDKNFNKAFKLTKKYINCNNRDEVINVIRYLELLINKDADIKREKNFIRPLMNYMKIHYKVLNDHIECCQVINKEYMTLKEKLDHKMKKLYKFAYPNVKIVVISKFETYNHELINRTKNIQVKSLETYNKKYNSIMIYQSVIGGLNLFLRTLSRKEHLFNGDADFIKNKSNYLKSLNDCFTKTFKPAELVDFINNLKTINVLIDEVKKNEIKVEYSYNKVHFIYKDIKDYKKKRISNLRLYNFDQIQNYNFMKKDLKEIINIEEIDINNIIDIKDDKKNFKLKMDMESKEFLYILQECSKTFSFQLEQMYNNNFIKLESLNNKIKKGSTEISATYNDAIQFYFSIKNIAVLYYTAVKYFHNKYNKLPQIPFLAIGKEDLHLMTKQIISLMYKNKLGKSKYEDLVNLFTYGNDGVYDLYYKPLITESGEHIKIVPSLFENNNFSRTFLNHMNLINASFKKGWIFEEYIKELFKSNDFIVYDKKEPKLNFKIDNSKKGDIDILICKGKIMFYGQIKNRTQPLENKDYIAFNRKINNVAIKQLKYAEEYLKSNPKHITSFFKIKDISEYKLVPFIVTNSFYGSGEKRNGISIIDTSALEVFFRGYISITKNNEVVFKKSLRNKNKSLEQNFAQFLEDPYFLDEKLYPNLFFNSVDIINDKVIMLGFDEEFQKRHFKNCYWK